MLENQLLHDISIKKDYVNQINKNNEYNEKVILEYYSRMKHEYSTDYFYNSIFLSDEEKERNKHINTILRKTNFDNKISNISSCNSLWKFDKYEVQKVKDFLGTNLCRDKFCNNCKKVKQANRMVRFIPYIDKFKDDYSLHHLTLTVPNCNGTDLHKVIKNIFSSFKSLNRYFNLDLKIRGLDFGQYGYAGSLRSLEITFKGDNYHPHLHCIFALDKNFNQKKHNINTYSYSYNNLSRLFSDLEVLIQKIWYLLINGNRVTKKAIDNLEEGYSCSMDSIDDSSYYEVFKYMTKSTDEKNEVLTYDNFKTLYFSLYRVRQIQGYGIFYNIKDDDSITDEVDELYDVIISILQAKEKPVEILESPQDVAKDNQYTYISRKRIFSYLKNL